MTQMDNKLVTLNTGRKISMTEYGDPQGDVVLFFHGFPGSRLEARHFHQQAKQNHCRLIAIDRPGMGDSDFNPAANFLSWADDIDELTNQLKIFQFSIIAHSGGTPFAAACGYKLKNKIKNMALISAVAPCDHPNYRQGMARSRVNVSIFLKRLPWLPTLMMFVTQKLIANPKEFNKQISKQLPAVDCELFANPQTKAMLLEATQEAFIQGLRGAAHEMKLFFKPWNFSLSEISGPVMIYHGEQDTQSPISHAKIYSESIPNAQLFILKNEGHISSLHHHFVDILNQLLK